MEKVDIILKGAWLVPGVGVSYVKNGAVAVRGNSIVDCGESYDIDRKYSAFKRVERPFGLITPGLVNTHTHVPMTLFRGMADDLPLKKWLEEHIFPAEAALNRELVTMGAELACIEMIRCGVSAFMDMYLFEDTIATVADSAGLRAWVGEGLFDFPSPAFNSGFEALKESARMMDKWQGHERITVTVDPHTPYTCSTELLKAALKLAELKDALIKIHVAETKWEDEEIRRLHGKSPVMYLDELGLLSHKTVMVHCVSVSEADLDKMAEKKVSVAHCPESNLKLASGIAPVPSMIKRGINVTLGTDGAASNNDLDILGEMDFAAKIHKGVSLDPETVSADSVFSMVTVNAAKAVALQEIGVIEPGKRADIAVFDLNTANMIPCHNPVSQLVYSARGGDAVDLMVEGKMVMEDRTILTMDEEMLFDRITKTLALN